MKSELEKIPGVGPNMAAHLHALGFDTVESLRTRRRFMNAIALAAAAYWTGVCCMSTAVLSTLLKRPYRSLKNVNGGIGRTSQIKRRMRVESRLSGAQRFFG